MLLRIFTEPQQGASYDDLLAVAQRTEECGFDAFFRSDHYLSMGGGDGAPGPTDAWITLAGLARDTTTDTRADAEAFAQKWQLPGFRRSMRRLTLVWAGFLIGEALLRVAIAAMWPRPELVAATQLLWVVAPVLLVGWSIRAGQRWAGAAPDGSVEAAQA